MTIAWKNLCIYVRIYVYKVRLVKAMVLPVVMYGCKSWTMKKTECWRIDAFELWCWRRLLRVPWTARISNQFILKEISPGISMEGMMLKLKLQYFGHLMQRVDSSCGQEEKGTTEDKMAGWHHWLDGRESGWTPGVGDGQGGLACCDSWGRKELDTTERLNWTELIYVLLVTCWWPYFINLVRVINLLTYFKWYKHRKIIFILWHSQRCCLWFLFYFIS